MSRETEIADLLRKAGSATTLPEQREFVRQAEELKNEAIESRIASSGWDAEDAQIRDTLVPGRVHELHTAATDWITELETGFDPREASKHMVAEASLWYSRVREDVLGYADEYAEQARNFARREAGKFGDAAEVAERAFLDEAQRLRATAVRSGLVVEASDDMDDDNDPAEPEMSATAASGLPEVGDNGNLPSDTMFPATNGTLPPEATSSNRAPSLQELAGPHTSQDVVPVNDPGLSNPQPFPVSGTTKESKMAVAQCPTCGGHGKVAVRRQSLPEITDIAKFAASGLDQIDQIADAKDNPSAPGIPYPADVAFPWTLNPAQQVPAAISQAEQQIGERNSKSPLLKGSSQQYVARGTDNSGWIGDAGARGMDYPGQQAPTGDGSSSDGYADGVYGHGGDNGNQPMLPYGHQEADDTTNNPNQWQVGQPTQADRAWATAVKRDPQLQQALAYVQRAQSSVRNSR